MSLLHNRRRVAAIMASISIALIVSLAGLLILSSDDSDAENGTCSFKLINNTGYTLKVLGVDGNISSPFELDTNNSHDFTCTEWTVIKITFPTDEVSCISDWNMSESKTVDYTILKKTAFQIMFTMNLKSGTPSVAEVGEGDIQGSGESQTPVDMTMAPTVPEKVTKVSTWSKLVDSVNSFDYVIVNTGGTLARIGLDVVDGKGYSTNQLIIRNNVHIVGDNEAGTNGFIRDYRTMQLVTPQSGSSYYVDISPVFIDTGAEVTISGVTFDGGAVWKYVTSTGNPDEDTKIKLEAQNRLQRGIINDTENGGVTSRVSFIRNLGTLNLNDECVIQNVYNEYGSHEEAYGKNGGGSPGGAVYSSNKVVINGVLIKDCYSLRGCALYAPTADSSEIKVAGNSILTHNGGPGTLFGSAIYAYRGKVTIDGGKINENFGVFTVATGGSVDMKSGEVCRNVHLSDKYSIQTNWPGAIYLFDNATDFKMSGGFITDNVTLYNYSLDYGISNGIIFIKNANITMRGGTVADNLVYYNWYDNKNPTKVHCDSILYSQGNGTSESTVDIYGGSIGYMYVYTVVSPSSPVYFKDGTKVALADGDLKKSSFLIILMTGLDVSGPKGTMVGSVEMNGIDTGYLIKDVISDSEHKIYIPLSGQGLTAKVKESIPLKGKPVIDGNKSVGSTLKVLFAQTSNITYLWYSVSGETWTLISSSTTYVVQSDHIGEGKEIVVVVTGTNGYSGSASSSDHKVIHKVDFAVDGDIYDADGVIEDKVFIVHGDTTTINVPYSIEDKSGYVFAGWLVYKNGNTRVIAATGSTITVDADLYITPNWISESQYHGSLIIEGVSLPVVPSEPESKSNGSS